jgi:ABC-type uncharacterized transport system substrate-binding protein
MKQASLSAVLVAMAVLTVGVPAQAQQPKKIFRIGYLSSGNSTSESTRSEAIRQRLREIGYIEGQNIALEYRYAEGNLDRAPELVADMFYGADLADSYRRVAYFVDRILKGAKPADLPVEQPMKFEFVINLKTAKQIGVTIPQWMLIKADRVIK